jgi:hypothetical protein
MIEWTLGQQLARSARGAASGLRARLFRPSRIFIRYAYPSVCCDVVEWTGWLLFRATSPSNQLTKKIYLQTNNRFTNKSHLFSTFKAENLFIGYRRECRHARSISFISPEKKFSGKYQPVTFFFLLCRTLRCAIIRQTNSEKCYLSVQHEGKQFSRGPQHR